MSKTTFKLHHIGINENSREDANNLVKLLSTIFNLDERTDKPGSPFAGDNIEVMPNNEFGTHGHIAFWVEDIEEAIAYLDKKNIKVDYTTIKRLDNGDIYVAYLEQEFGGFAIHLFHK